tara:strand:+ start:6654 stop:7184 length:531 start_codon:yes stop_codon:yes gene_type:complete
MKYFYIILIVVIFAAMGISKKINSTFSGLSLVGENLIKFYEDFRAKAYKDAAGFWTIGYGTLLENKQDLLNKYVYKGETMTKSTASNFLRKHTEIIEQDIKRLVSVPLTQGQGDALVSFIYNVGIGNFNSSTLLKKLNAQDYDGAASEFSKWKYAGGKVLNGLVIRRKREQQLFLS